MSTLGTSIDNLQKKIKNYITEVKSTVDTLNNTLVQNNIDSNNQVNNIIVKYEVYIQNLEGTLYKTETDLKKQIQGIVNEKSAIQQQLNNTIQQLNELQIVYNDNFSNQPNYEHLVSQGKEDIEKLNMELERSHQLNEMYDMTNKQLKTENQVTRDQLGKQINDLNGHVSELNSINNAKETEFRQCMEKISKLDQDIEELQDIKLKLNNAKAIKLQFNEFDLDERRKQRQNTNNNNLFGGNKANFFIKHKSNVKTVKQTYKKKSKNSKKIKRSIKKKSTKKYKKNSKSRKNSTRKNLQSRH
jgi:DNA repair exonuclease SbcCD ATPase subunit